MRCNACRRNNIFSSLFTTLLWPLLISHVAFCNEHLLVTQYSIEAKAAKERFQFETAKEVYEKIIAADPENPIHHVEISKLWIALHDVEQSRKSLEQALELEPHHPDALFLLAVYYQHEKQDVSKTQELLKQTLNYHPNHIQSQKLLLELLIQLRQFDDASILINTIQLDKLPAGYIEFQKGLISFLNNDFETSLGLLLTAEKEQYPSPEIHRYLAQIYNQQQNTTLAKFHHEKFQTLQQTHSERKQLLQLLRLNPNDAGRWFALGIHYLSNSELKLALKYLDNGLKLDSSQEKTLSLAGKIALQLKQPTRAVKFIKNALEINDSSSDNWNNLGVCHMLANNYELAVEAFETSIQKGNLNPQVKLNLELAQSKVKFTN